MKRPRPPLPQILKAAGFIFFVLGCGAGAGFQGQIPAAGNALPSESPPLSYKIHVQLDDAAKTLVGEEDIVWANQTQEAVPDMLFHLYYNALKNEKSAVMEESAEQGSEGPPEVKEGEWGWIDVVRIGLADGRDLTPTMEFVPMDEPGHPGDQTVMRVRFPESVMPGQSIHLQLKFKARIPKNGLRSGYYGHSYFIGQWYPKPGVYEVGKGWNCHEYHLDSEFFADFADFTVDITVPENFVVGASGRLVRSVSDKSSGRTTFTYAQSWIHDFAWTASPEFIKVERSFIADAEVAPNEYEQTARQLGLTFEGIKLPNVKMILLIERQHENQVERHFTALKKAIKYYGLWYGPYPYETVTMVDPPFRTDSGGMEYPTLFTAGTSKLIDKKSLWPEEVIVHEFGHQYWYGLVANNEFEEAWLDEGITTYSYGKILSRAYGPGSLRLSFKGIPLGWFFDLPRSVDFEFDRMYATTISRYDPVVAPSWKFYSSSSYAANVYMRAATCLNTLDRFLGQDIMARIMRTFQTRFRFKHPTTWNFVDTVNEISGKDMAWFFEELFFNTLNFDYGIVSLQSVKKPQNRLGVFDIGGKKEEVTDKKLDESAKRDKSKPTIYLTTVTLRRIGEARIRGGARLKVKVVFEDGSQEVRLWDGQDRWARMTFEKSAKARLAQIDPETIWLIDSNLANNSSLITPERKGILRFSLKFLFWLQNILESASTLIS